VTLIGTYVRLMDNTARRARAWCVVPGGPLSLLVTDSLRPLRAAAPVRLGQRRPAFAVAP